MEVLYWRKMVDTTVVRSSSVVAESARNGSTGGVIRWTKVGPG